METFILKVQNYPFLWDSDDPHFRDVIKKNATWRHVAQECGLENGIQAKMMWKKLRCSHREAMRRRSIDKTLAPWKYEKLMEFLVTPSQHHSIESVSESEDVKDYEMSTLVEIKEIKSLAEDEPSEEIHNAGDAGNKPEISMYREKRRQERTKERAEQRHSIFDVARSSSEGKDSLAILFASLYQKTKSLPMHLQLRVQREIFSAVNCAEEEALALGYSPPS